MYILRAIRAAGSALPYRFRQPAVRALAQLQMCLELWYTRAFVSTV